MSISGGIKMKMENKEHMHHMEDNEASLSHNANCLCVNCGCNSEAKQFEYHNRLEETNHKGHNMNEKEMQKMSHHDHEAAMTNPQIAKEMEADMKKRFLISLLLSIPIFLYSPVGVNLLRLNLPSPISINWLLFILTTPIVFWTGSIFISGAYYSLKAKKLNMSVLISTGVLAAYLFSVLITFIGGETFYEAAALLVTFVLFGHLMEMKSRRGTSEALRSLFDLIPPKARVIRNGREIVILSSEIIKRDIVVLKPGDKVPVDGEIIRGETVIDESLVTGESIPISKNIGDIVIGGSVNQSGTIQFKATQIGSETVLANIIKLVETAQNSKAPGQKIADKAAAWLVVVALGSGVLTFLGWYFVAGVTLLAALTFAVSAIVIACPDALGLATPTAVAVGTGIGAKHNILIKDAATLENISKLNAIVLDKTGTLTEGKPRVTDLISFNRFKEKEVLVYTASVEAGSNHPIAKAIIEEAEKRGVDLLQTTSFGSIAGNGLKAKIKGKEILVGSHRLLNGRKVDTTGYEDIIEKLSQDGKTLSLISIGGIFAGIIAVSDTLKPSSKKAIDELKELGIEVAMITGDNKSVAESVAKQLGIERVFAEVLPADKSKYVKQLQSEGKFVAMVGDGINDAPALAQADIGIAIGAGTDVAIETGSVVLMKSDPHDIVVAIRLSKATVKKMKQNLFWAAIYNILAIPVAAGVFYNSLGLSLRPEISALLMSVSSIIVAANAVLLKRVEKRL